MEIKPISMSTQMVMPELAAQEISIAPQSAIDCDDSCCSKTVYIQTILSWVCILLVDI